MKRVFLRRVVKVALVNLVTRIKATSEDRHQAAIVFESNRQRQLNVTSIHTTTLHTLSHSLISNGTAPKRPRHIIHTTSASRTVRFACVMNHSFILWKRSELSIIGSSNTAEALLRHRNPVLFIRVYSSSSYEIPRPLRGLSDRFGCQPTMEQQENHGAGARCNSCKVPSVHVGNVTQDERERVD